MIGQKLCLLVASLCLLSWTAQCAVLSIDLGSEWMKVAVVNIKPGQSPISIAINEMSKRKTPSMVGFSGDDMLVGEAASGISARYPEKVYTQLHRIVGKRFDDVKKHLDSKYLPYDIVEDKNGGALIRIDDGESVFTFEELLAILLSHAKTLGEAHAKTVIKDAVIAVPAYLGQTERKCITAAAELGGLNVLALVNQHSGVALQYGIDKDFAEAPRHVLFYDMGAGGAYASLVYYSAYTTKEFGKNKTVNQFQVKDVRWDASIGGDAMELRLLEYCVDLFNREIGGAIDIRMYPKAVAKLKKQVKRTKEVLSANSEATLSVEGLHDNRDFRTVITRKKFEELCEDLWERAIVPIKEVLHHAKLSVDQLHSVELIGGATRVPKLQNALSEFLEKKGHDRHLDADEAIVLGAALHAANLSDGIKMNRKLGMVDGATFALFIKVKSAVPDSAVPEEDKYDLVVPRLKKLPSKVVKSFMNSKDFAISLLYDASEILPPGVSSNEIAAFQISGVTEAFSKYEAQNLSAPIKTNLHFFLSRSGILSLDRAETVVEFFEWVDVPSKNTTSNETKAKVEKLVVTPPENESNGPEDTNNRAENGAKAQASDAIDQNDIGNASTSVPEVVMEKKLRKRTIRVPLKMKDASSGLVRPMSEEARIEAALRLEKIKHQEEEKRSTAEAKNSLESYIYMTKEKLEFTDGLGKVTTEEQREKFLDELGAAENWLYEEETTASKYKKRLDSLKAVGESMFMRLTELVTRPAAVDFARKYVEDLKETVDGWSKSKPWIEESKKNELLESADDLLKWLAGKQAEQEKKSAHEDPAFLSDDVYSKVTKLEQKLSKVSKIPKPKPKVEPEKKSTSNSSSSPREDDVSKNEAGKAEAGREGDSSSTADQDMIKQEVENTHDEL